MAINKKFISFATQEQFDAKVAELDDRSIVFIEDTKRIWTHGVFFDTSWNHVTDKPTTLSEYGITDAAKKINSLYYVEGNTTGTAGAWTGSIPEITSLYAGLTIAYKIGVAGASTTNLNINSLGNKLVRRNTSNLTTHLPVGSVVILTYDGTYWVWADYTDGTESYTVRWNAAIKAGAEITQYKLLVQGSDGRYYPTTIGNTTAGTKTISTVPFLIGSPIIFYLYTPTIAAGGVTSSSYNYTGVTTSTTTYAWNKNSGWRANEDVYLKGTVNGALFTLDNTTLISHMTQDLPTTEDGFYYMRLGMFTNTTTGFRLSLQHPVYYFADGELQSLNTSSGADWNDIRNLPSTFTPSAHTLGSHSDVTITSNTSGEILKWNGTKWINNTLAEAGIATPANITTAISNLEIGGRNLFSNLNTVIGQSGLLTYSKRDDINGFYSAGGNNGYENHVRLSNVIKGNGYYTVSFEMRGTQSSPVRLYVSIAGVRSASRFITNNLNTYNGRKYCTVEVTNYSEENSHVDFHLAYAYFYIKDIKVEKGNKPTDWTPAPEDQVSDWNTTDVNSFSFIKNKPTSLSQFTDNIGVATHIANKANPHSVTKSQVGLGNVDNTSDLNKPISTATQTALNLKLDKSVFDDLFEKVEVSTGVFAIKAKYNFYGVGEVSAYGFGTGGSGGGSYDRLDAWVDYDSTKSGWVLSALLGNELNTRVSNLEGGSALTVNTTGTGNAITSISKSGTVITADKGLTFSLSNHLHTGVYEPTFSKNTAFNKNFGTTSGTVAQGNDSRIINGQTAFGWGNHATAGYALNSAFNTHNNDNIRHITGAERTSWNGVVTDFGNLEIGGRNLVLESDTPVSTSAYMVAEYFITEDFIEGETYTLSLKGTKLASQNFGLWQNTGSNSRGNLVHKGNDIYQLTFPSIATTAGNERRIRIYQPNSTTAGPATIDWIKLEKGNKATDWTPAPEDQVSDWLTTDVNSFSFIKNKPSTFTPSAHTHNASDINAGVLGIARIPTGTTSSTVALGNHTHSYLPLSGGTLTGNLTAPSFIGSLSGNASTATTATTATKVNNNLILKFDTGTTENTNLYTFNGSSSKTINIIAGSNISMSKAANSITISATNTNTTYSTGTLAQLNAGTDTTGQLHTAKLLNDWINGKGYITSYTNTTYTAGSGLTLSGTQFSLPVTVSGSGTFVKSVTQGTSGVSVVLGTPPNTNTTYSAGSGISLSSTTFSVAGGYGLVQETSGLKLGDPSTITNTTTNSVTATSHTHELSITKADILALGISEEGPQGPQGPQGPRGYTGDKGDAPAHSWSGTYLRFQTPTGSWGSYVNLKGDPGAPGTDGSPGPQGPRGYNGADGVDGSPGPQGPRGYNGADGLTTSISVNGSTYNQSSGVITLPNYVPASGGTFTGNISAAAFYQDSDIRLKNIIKPLEINIKDILNIPSFYFTYKDKDKERINIGTSAQEVQKVFPEIVSTNSKGMLSVEYDKLGLIALEINKKQQKEINDLKNELNLLKLKLTEYGYRN